MTIAIYGAEPYPPNSPNILATIIRALKRTRAYRRDAKNIRLGDLNSLDYRNYISPYTVNQGDIAIARSATGFVQTHRPEESIEFVRWGELERQDAAWSEFVVAGSGYVTFDGDGNLSRRLLDDMSFFKEHGIRPLLFGIGINRPKATTPDSDEISLDSQTESKLRELLSMAKAISVRDQFTQTTLSHFTDKRVELVGDPALHFGSLHGIRHSDRTDLTGHRPQIGLNLNFHGPSSTRLLQRNLPIVASALKSIREEHHCDFRYFVHFDTSRVIPKLLALEGIEMDVIQGTPETLARGYAKLDMHIGGMLHSCILAHSMGTPAIALAYDIKHRGFMELFGLEHNCLPSAELTESDLTERVREVLNNLPATREIIARTRERLELISHDFINQNLSD